MGDRGPLRYQVAFFLTALLTLALVVTLPFSVKHIVDDILGTATGRVAQITPRGSARRNTSTSEQLRSRSEHYTKLHLAVTALDELQLRVTIRVSGHHRCAGCAWSHRVRLVAVAEDDAAAHGLPPSVAVTLAPTDIAVSEMVQLPLRGHPVRYPFDEYRLVLGVAYQRVYPDGRREVLSADQADDQLFLSFQELLPRSIMTGPFPVHPQPREDDDPFAYGQAFEVRFERPPYVRVLAVMLVVLIAAAAAYSVFLRPLHDLVVNAGALVLGVWGIRSILIPPTINYITAVDLSLSMVIIFVLGALVIRALVFVHDAARMGLLGRRPSDRR
jgi:hypothetical protein